MQNTRATKARALFLLSIFLYNTFFPTLAMALTGGPSQPEVQSFEPIGTSEMVDLSTGSFTYNIPLLDVGGYPINLAYNAGTSMDQEASCVGFGWNINPGVVNRNMRGLPDDFDGEDMKKEQSMRPNRTYGGNVGADWEIFGTDKIKLGLQAGIFYNNYRGIGLEFGINPSLMASKNVKDGMNANLGLNLNLNINSQSGATASAAIQPSVSFVEKGEEAKRAHRDYGLSGGLSYNSRQGLMAATMGVNMKFGGTEPSTGKQKTKSIEVGASTFSFARPTYLPSANFPVLNTSFTLRGAIEAVLFGSDPGINISGYFSSQKLAFKTLTAKGYGTLYLHNQQPGVSLLDFNREKEGAVTQNTPNLALPIAAQDIYSVSGQGIGGNYLLKRSDIGMFNDKETSVQSGSGNLSLEFGGGNLTKFGADIIGVGVESKSGRWSQDNPLATHFAFKGSDATNLLYEPAYFKPAGEQSVESDPTLFNNIGGFSVVAAKLQKDGSDKFKVSTTNTLKMGLTGGTKTLSGVTARTVREKRNQNISYLTAKDAARVGLQRNILSYTKNNFTVAPTPISRVGGKRKTSHISEVTTLREDGSRYIYGIPAYNNLQQDYTFSVAQLPDCRTGLVNYSTTERSRNNNAGLDRYYSMEETPPYAHSYLLTAVVSPEYADIDGREGPTEGDNGSYTRFNYTRTDSTYKWRLPFPNANDGTGRQANFIPGLLSTNKDNKASLVYGEKETWQLHSIESKMYVAEFYYSDRNDALGVTGVDGLRETTKRQVKLDSIVLYAKADRIVNAAAAVPIKKVTFVYKDASNFEYMSSKNVPNNSSYVYGSNVANSGKLTLQKVYFTYGRSEKGRFSPYQFFYTGASKFTGSGADSLGYNYLSYNRWGNFQRSLKGATTDCDPSDPPGNDDVPYAIQDSTRQATFAPAWNLTAIQLPSGGRIDVTYESHDYAYVQNKSAMQMFQVAGVGSSTTFGTGNQLYNADLTKNPYYYLYFKGTNSFAAHSDATARNIIGRDYIKDIKDGYVYFKCLVDLKTTAVGGAHYEYIYGYAKIDDSGGGGWGRCAGNPAYGFIRLKPVCIGDKEKGTCSISLNPITKAGFQYTRLNAPDLIHSTNLTENQSVSGVNAFIQLIEAFGDIFKNLQTMLTGPNQHMRLNNFSRVIELKKSFIRLYNPVGTKFAGGSRVKRIQISDNWSTMSGVADNGIYGQEYSYKTTLDLGKNLGDGVLTRQISSGVASYEPMIGGDENPFRQPEFYDETMLLAPDNRYYQEHPFGESYFPSPQIVYSKVTVTSVKYNNAGTIVTPQCVSTGQTVSEYYTAKDFPTRVTRSTPQMIPSKSSPLGSFLKLNFKDFLTASQGYCIELNDMHGKPKAQWNFDDKSQRISGVEYQYKTKMKDTDPTAGVNWVPMLDSLDNTAQVIQRNGKVTNAQIGVDFQMVSDARESYQETRTRGVALNVDVFLFGIFPGAAVVPLPIWETEKTRFRSVVISKVINRYALLEKVIAYDASSRVETQNLAYDAETGEVLLTRTFNEFGDPIYNLKLPAHFAYPGMRPAYENLGVELNNIAVVLGAGGGTANKLQMASNTISYFKPGDELMIYTDEYDKQRAWVLNVNTSDFKVELLDIKGKDVPFPIGSIVNVKIIRSGYRNQQSAPIASITLRTNPIVLHAANDLRLKLNDASVSSKILNAVATEYSDNWRVNQVSGCTDTLVTASLKGSSSPDGAALIPYSVTNPYSYGRRGNWRPRRSWVYLQDRIPISPTTNYATNVRANGTYNSFASYWNTAYDATNIWTANNTGWTWTNEVTKYSPHGFELENKDPLGRYTAELPGYGNTQAIATAANARVREIASVNFEENNLSFLEICTNKPYQHFPPFNNGTPVTTYRHSGTYSLRVNPSSEASTGLIIYAFGSNDVTEGSLDAPAVESRTSNGQQWNGQYGFRPDSTYLFSAWVRTDTAYAINKTTYKRTNNTHPRILVFFRNSTGTQSTTFQLDPSGPIIDGWQRISQKILIPSYAQEANVRLMNGTAQNAYFDDFRVQPLLSAMKTYVYDIRSNRLLATLDDENYATFYEYDQNGNLERVKRETERGIMTLQESRTSLKKQ